MNPPSPLTYDDLMPGPTGAADAAMLAALVNYIKPEYALELGCLWGHASAVLAPHCGTLFCVDPVLTPQMKAWLRGTTNVVYVPKPAEDWTPPVENIGFVFSDAVHETDPEVAYYRRYGPCLAPDAVIVIHDCGRWRDPPWTQNHADLQELFVTSMVPGERGFAKFLCEQEGFQRVALGPVHVPRQGLCVLQRPWW